MQAPFRTMLLLTLLLATLLPPDALVGAVRTHFQHHFLYERAGGTTFTNTSASSTTAPQGVSFGGSALLARWNTRTVVAQFGMEPGARVDIDVRALTYPPLSAPAPDGVRSSARQHVPLVFTLYDDDQWRVYSVLQLRDVPLRNPAILCHYPSTMRFAVTAAGFNAGSDYNRGRDNNRMPHSVSFVVQKASLYTLQMQVCGDASVDVEGTAKMVNLGFDGRLSEHLGADKIGLVPLYKVVVIAYTLFTMLWVIECYLRRRNVPRIGYAFQGALHVKTIDATLKLWLFRELSATGVCNTMLDALQTASESAASGVLLAVLLYAALGWSLTRNTLSRRERQVIAAVFSVYTAIALVKAHCSAADEQAQQQRLGEPNDVCKVYMLIEYVVRSAVMLGVIVALNYTITQLRLALTDAARWHHCVTPLTYMKLRQFYRFRAVFLLYLLLPTFLLIVSLLVISPPGSWRFAWVDTLLSECAALLIYTAVGLILRPLDAYIYARISKGTNLRSGNASAGTDNSTTNNTDRQAAGVHTTNSSTDAADSDVGLAAAAAVMSSRVMRELPSGAAVVPVGEQVLESNRRLLAQYRGQ